MRELKFRAWDTEAKCYVKDPILVDNFGQVYVVCEEANNKRGTCLITHKPNVILERYTELRDKNGKEIYEGDIVRYAIRPSRTTVVEWWSGEEEYYPCCTTSGFALPDSEDGYEAIGNIHENPELIEGN
jgi:uncharacterized phage protein (TIGR01671 family)